MAYFKSFLNISRESEGAEVTQTVDIPVEISLKVGDDVEGGEEADETSVDEVVVAQEAEEAIADLGSATAEADNVGEVIQDAEANVADQEEILEENPESVTESTVAIAAQSFAFNAKRLNVAMESFIPASALSHESVAQSPISSFRIVHEAEKSFLQKVKDWFVKLWENIKKLAKRVWDALKSLFMSTKKRVEYIKANKGKLAELNKIKADAKENEGTIKKIVNALPAYFVQGSNNFIAGLTAGSAFVKGKSTLALGTYEDIPTLDEIPSKLNQVRDAIQDLPLEEDVTNGKNIKTQNIGAVSKSKIYVMAKTSKDKAAAKYTIAVVDSEVKEDGHKKLFKNNLSGLTTLGDVVPNVFQDIEAFSKQNGINKIIKAAIAKAESLSEGKDVSEDNKRAVSEYVSIVNNAASVMILKMPTYTAKSINEVVNGLFTILKIAENYEAPKKDSKKK